jgi:hypothetical protein
MRLFRSPWKRRRGERGQALVEFSLVIMIFITVIVALCEFSFLLTTKIGVTDAAQDAVQLASQLGNTNNADFQVLQLVERDMSAPIDRSKIVSVEVFRTNSYGKTNLGENKYNRSGSWTIGANTVPYTQVGFGYEEVDRCNVISGAGCTHTGGVDYIGVTITYQYTWITPLPNLAGLGTTAPTFVQSSVSRLEPIQ